MPPPIRLVDGEVSSMANRPQRSGADTQMKLSTAAVRVSLVLASALLSVSSSSRAQSPRQFAPIYSAVDEWDLITKIAEGVPKAIGAGVDAWRNWRCTRVLSHNLTVAQAERDSLARAQVILAAYAGSKTILINDLEDYVLDPDTARWRLKIVPQLKAVERSANQLQEMLRSIPGSIPSDTASAAAYLASVKMISMKFVQLQRLENLPAPSRANRGSLRAVQKFTRLLQSELDALTMASVELGRHFGPGGLQPAGCPNANV
jgi:hypothetical protein